MIAQISNLESLSKLNFLNKGYKLYKRERYQEALNAFDMAIAMNEENMFGEAYLCKGASLLPTGHQELAEEAYDRAINKLCSGVYYNKGLLLSKTGWLSEAHSCYERAIELEPNDPKLYYEIGRNLNIHDRVFAQEAVKAFDEALKLKPDYGAAYCYRGDALYRQKKYHEAIIEYDQAIALKPEDSVYYYKKGIALSYKQEYEEAIVAYDQAIEI
ncbi:tetratricopeptide repeat protein [Rickettsia endosymbiont of Pantilius tunicatus]|uniref:tetratricopeptide repeat protein n=1 Tax=Rickettsia endosymbiont of Pantilius tunicatus TaxID=3066267 RepID=UPI0030E4FE0C